MTSQVPDSLVYKGRDFVIAGLDGKLPGARAIGLKDGMISTSCYRGYVARYACDLTLNLTELRIWHGANPPALLGCTPRMVVGSTSISMFAYEGLEVPCTGVRRLVVAANCSYPEFWWVVPQPAAFEHVLELSFQEGRLVDVCDRSDAVARIREQLGNLLERAANLEGPEAPDNRFDIMWSFTTAMEAQPPLDDD